MKNRRDDLYETPACSVQALLRAANDNLDRARRDGRVRIAA